MQTSRWSLFCFPTFMKQQGLTRHVQRSSQPRPRTGTPGFIALADSRSGVAPSLSGTADAGRFRLRAVAIPMLSHGSSAHHRGRERRGCSPLLTAMSTRWHGRNMTEAKWMTACPWSTSS